MRRAKLFWPKIALVAAALAICIAAAAYFFATPLFAPGKDQVVFIGDSITEGAGANPETDSRPALYEAKHPDIVDVKNLGVNGITLGSIAGAGEPAQYRWRAKNVAVVLGGINDINLLGVSGEAVYKTLLDYTKMLKGRGWTVVAGTVLSCKCPPEKERERVRLNDLIRSGELSRQGVILVDFAKLQDRGQVPIADGIHPTAVGYAAMSALESPVIDGALR